MAATFSFSEDNSNATSSPAKGTTRTAARTEINFKSIDDSTTAYSSSPIVAGLNSFTKYQFGVFSGSFNTISSCLWAHTSGTLGLGLAIKGVVTSTYATPSQTAFAPGGVVDMTTAIAIGSGQAVLFSTVGPEGASPTSTLTAAGYTQFLAVQMQTLSTASSGDSASITLTLQYSES